ncbi:hypothetical protein H2248_002617 [Termitomyces sp. 'cryptogamus']|nr:hypothetical protein H2248_002617 [Termitomyces sp. 'cryptogamus']
MRPLTLHASALNDEEYELYTASLRDLNDYSDSATHDDAYYEGTQVGVREVRGWMRGRYAHLQPGILRFFAPGLENTDVLTGGQFFAALRLVVHADQGKDVDRNLGFVQAHPAPPKITPAQPVVPPHSPHNPFVARVPPLPPRKTAPQPLATPPKHVSTSLLPPSRKSTSPTRPAPPVHHPPLPPPPHHPPVPPKPTHVTSTLIKQSLQASKAAQSMKRAEAQLEGERVMQVLKRSSVVSTLPGARVERSSIVVGASVSTTQHNNHNYSPSPPSGEATPSISSGESIEGRAPPLPRRRNTRQQQPSPPVSVSSLEQVALARTPSESTQVRFVDRHISGAPLISTPPPPPARSSTNPFPVSNTQSSTTNNPYPHPSTPSFMSYTASPQGSPSRGTTDLPPPTHPDRLPPAFTPSTPSTVTSPLSTTVTNDSQESPTTRVFRSKSLHYPSPPFPSLSAAPPRPESMQVIVGTGDRNSLTTVSLSRHSSNSALTHGPHKRQTSLSATFASLGLERDKEGQERTQEERESPLGKFARSWQPRLEKARYKAEAGLSRRGFVRNGDRCERSRSKGPEETEDLLASSPFDGNKGNERLAGGWQGRGYSYEYEGYDPPSVDGSVQASSDDDSSPHRLSERDGLKWPVGEGEGWRPL